MAARLLCIARGCAATRGHEVALPNLDAGPPEVPSLEEVQRLLADARFEHRRIHLEEGTAR